MPSWEPATLPPQPWRTVGVNEPNKKGYRGISEWLVTIAAIVTVLYLLGAERLNDLYPP